MGQQQYDTTLLTRLVSELYGAPISVEWGNSTNMPEGILGQANCYVIRLHSSLARNADPILPYAFFHELGRVLLHKRGMQGKYDVNTTFEEREKEAELFGNQLLLTLGAEFVMSALNGDLSYDEERRAKSEIMKLADSTLFRRNQVKQTYQRGGQGDVEVSWHRQPQASVYHRSRRTEADERAQGQRELTLAAKVERTNPQVAEMIRASAQAKLGHTTQHGRRNEAPSSAPYEKATWSR